MIRADEGRPGDQYSSVLTVEGVAAERELSWSGVGGTTRARVLSTGPDRSLFQLLAPMLRPGAGLVGAWGKIASYKRPRAQLLLNGSHLLGRSLTPITLFSGHL